jgi:hypothetical protein
MKCESIGVYGVLHEEKNWQKRHVYIIGKIAKLVLNEADNTLRKTKR